MILTDEIAEDLVSQYGITKSSINRLYNVLITYPCVSRSDEPTQLFCLETLISDRMSALNSKRENPQLSINTADEARTLKESVEYALYKVYGAEALQYLSDDFKDEYIIEEIEGPIEDVDDDDYTFDDGFPRH